MQDYPSLVLPLNWLASGLLDSVNASFERGRRLGGSILHWKKKSKEARLKCLGSNASEKQLIGPPLPSESQFHPFTSVSVQGMLIKKAVREW